METLTDTRKAATLEDLRTPDMNRTRTNAAGMLMALQLTGGHIYGGTVDPAEVQRRRAANRAARKARRAARKARR